MSKLAIGNVVKTVDNGHPLRAQQAPPPFLSSDKMQYGTSARSLPNRARHETSLCTSREPVESRQAAW